MPFIQGESYTRDHIHEVLGGEKVSYLPQKDGKIVCGCFSTDANPEAPYVILVGGDDEGGESPVERKARILEAQDEPIPVFLKRASNDWVYEGNFRLQRVNRDRQFLADKQRQAGRIDVVMALILESVQPTAITYLLTWNPNSWRWENLEDEVRVTAQGRQVDDRWSCGNTKRIRVGDRLFLLRQGVEPRGIMAAGWATSATYEGPHWDSERRSRGDTTLFVDLRFDRILNPEYDEILPLEKLQAGPLGSVNWSTPASGIQIRQGVDDLERLWAELVGIYQPIGEDEPGALEGELRLALSRHRARERWLRDAKIAEVKRANGGRLPCQACGFEFFAIYGEIGRDYAQVHHLKPLSDRTKPSMTKLSDLAVLCANCHAMVHRDAKIRSLDDFRQAIQLGIVRP
jgi:5-methylcytosine-specific restriction protein A